MSVVLRATVLVSFITQYSNTEQASQFDCTENNRTPCVTVGTYHLLFAGHTHKRPSVNRCFAESVC